VKTYKFYSSLASLEEQLADRGFLRIQKSYLVNMRHLRKLQCAQAVLDNGTVLPVSEKTYGEQRQKYLLWKGRQ
jgi:DNA-binding LytR/AlgR family response regulator